jgi:hypothetical protein
MTGSVKCVNVLIKADPATVDAPDSAGSLRTPLHVAAARGDTGCVCSAPCVTVPRESEPRRTKPSEGEVGTRRTDGCCGSVV